MTRINLTTRERQAIQSVVETLQDSSTEQVDRVLRQMTRGNESAIRRFVAGAYNHPITWWIGIFQLQMQKGMWGRRHQAAARIRANHVTQVTRHVRNEAISVFNGSDAPILSAIVVYNLTYRKADIIGRFLGGQATHYASTGGPLGRTRLSVATRRTLAFTSLGIASYGAAIKAVHLGYQRVDALIQAILTGRPEVPPISYSQDIQAPLSSEASELLMSLSAVLDEVVTLTQVTTSPIPIAEFCARPENINLTSVCE